MPFREHTEVTAFYVYANRGRKCYIADTGLLVAHYFMDDKFTDNELYRDIYI